MPDRKIKGVLQSLIETRNDPFVLIDQNFTIVAANQAYADQYDCETDDIVGCKCHKISHHSDEPCYKHGEDCPLVTCFSTKSKTEVMHVHTLADGAKECVEITAHPVFDNNGDVQYMGEQIHRLETQDTLENEGLVGSAPKFLEAIQEAKLLASGDLPVLLNGESGVGKERFASYLHKRSRRKDEPFITLDCCGLSETLFESELFGHEAGSFTGANKRKEGLFEIAHGGTLFLDEIGEISLTIQAKLLRVLETGQFRRVGGTKTLTADVRIVSATNQDLKEMVLQGQFRNDLYFRLAGHTIWLPPLRERKDDIKPLLCHFAQKLNLKSNISSEAMQLLSDFHFPGNVRELRYVVELALLKSAGQQILPEHLPDQILRHAPRTSDVAAQFADDVEQNGKLRRQEDQTILGVDTERVLESLSRNSGSRRRAASDLGLPERKIYRLINIYKERGIPVPEPYQ